MAITIKKEKRENNEKETYKVEITNGHVDALENIVEKYKGIENEAQALDFIIKASGKTEEKTDGIVVNGIKYLPADYSN